MIKMVQVAQIETLINAALKVIGREVIFKVASVARGRKRPIADYQRCPEVRGNSSCQEVVPRGLRTSSI